MQKCVMELNMAFRPSCAVDAWRRVVRAESTLITAAQRSSAPLIRPSYVQNTSNHAAVCVCVRQVKHDGVSAIMK